MTKQQFAKLIKDKRKSLSLTQSQFGELLGLSWITIWRWENEKEAPNDVIMKLWVSFIEKLPTTERN